MADEIMQYSNFEKLGIREMLKTPEAYGKVNQIVNKVYLPHLEHYDIVPLEISGEDFDIAESACLFPIKKIVFDKEENNIQKLASVYSGGAAVQANLVLMIRGFANGEVELHLGVCDESNRVNGAYPKAAVLYDSFVGQFPGSRGQECQILDSSQTRLAVNKCFDSGYKAVVSVSCIASLRGREKAEKNNSFYQGIEKVLEAMQGKDYSIVILSRAVSPEEIQGMRAELEKLSTQLSSFAKINVSASHSDVISVSEAFSQTLSESVNQTYSNTLSTGTTKSKSDTQGSFENTSTGFGGGAEVFNVNTSYGSGRNQGHTDTEGSSDTKAKGKTKGINKGKTDGKTDSKGLSSSDGKTIQISIGNKKITETLVNITKQIQRLKTGSGIGLFSTAAYFLAPSLAEARSAACTYKAIVSGDNTNLENTGINAWSKDGYEEILKYLRRFMHPQFLLEKRRENMVEMIASPATLVTSSELALQMGLPQKSVQGISVKESVSFGRNIMRMDRGKEMREVLPLGHMYHLGHEESGEAYLDLNSLTMHSFIAGSNGSGKSNTVYDILNELCYKSKGIHFMVIEPAKGEYKAVFGGREDVKVYGTNPYKSELLRINPFRFGEDIHVLEHIDRLIGIFNVCWPMYAAMPAVLKDAVERAYENAGWNLRTSRNKYHKKMYPAFADVMREIEQILDESKYSKDTKGDYVGSLCTRLRSLTTGINGMIFVSDDLSDDELFNTNVIVDLSRIGAAETKALIMGLLVIRLQEYRMSSLNMNARLNHVTVIEEAHHLLKRTSTEQSMEGANLVGHSVEMLGNALAEMRTYGEGFIIVDQSPGMMDMSVIRNTNTKIIMRLPDQSDRELVGKAMGLNEAQIVELAKLPQGVASVYQNDWLESVLVKMPRFEEPDEKYEYTLDETIFENPKEDALLDAIMKRKVDEWIDGMEGNVKEAITALHLPTTVKCRLFDYSNSNGKEKFFNLSKIAYGFFNTKEAMEESFRYKKLDEWKKNFVSLLQPAVDEYAEDEVEFLTGILLREQALNDERFKQIYYCYADSLKKKKEGVI